MEKLPHGIDRYEAALDFRIRRLKGTAAELGVLRELARSRQSLSTVTRVGVLEGESATRLVKRLFEAQLKALRRGLQSSWSGHRWLFYLRRAPERLFAGGQAQSGPLRQRLAEISTLRHARGNCTPLTDGLSEMGFQVDDEVARQVFRVALFAQDLHRLSVILRFTGKGAALRVHPNGDIEEHVSQELVAAAALFDERLQRTPNRELFGDVFDSRVSGVAWPALMTIGFGHENPVIPVSAIADPSDLNLPPLSLKVRFAPQVLPMARVAGVMNHPAMTNPSLWSEELTYLFVLMTLNFLIIADNPRSRFNLFQVGYMIHKKRQFFALYDQHASQLKAELSKAYPPFSESIPTDGESFIRGLARIRGSCLPLLPGPIVFSAGPEMIGLDLVAASWRLRAILAPPRTAGGAVVDNVRGAVFEQAVQRVVDGSPWRPKSEHIKEIPRRQLRLSGGVIGDIDAIGQHGSTLLAISCKSRLYTSQYDSGDYGAIRNTTTALIADIRAWESFLVRLRLHPVGDNYDLSDLKIVGVLVTPATFFLPFPEVEQTALPGLRFYSSVTELAEWLGGSASALISLDGAPP